MSQENVDVVLGQFESTNARDFAAVTDEWAEDVIAVAHLAGIGGQVGTGKEAVAGWFWNYFREFASDWRSEVEEFRDLGDRVLIFARHHARGRASGAQVTSQNAYLYTVRGGKVSQIDVWADRDEALEAAGLSE